jgi:hypothetical protein
MRLPARVQQAIDASKWPDRGDFDSLEQAAQWLKTLEAKQLEARLPSPVPDALSPGSAVTAPSR